MSAGFSSEDFINALKETRDPRELAYQKLAELLFDEKKLYMIGRIRNTEEFVGLIQNIILIDFYQGYYSKINIKKTIVKHPKPPYYQFVSDEDHTFRIEYEKHAYQQFIDNIIKLGISFYGKSRSEILNVLKAADTELSFKDRIKERLTGGNQN